MSSVTEAHQTYISNVYYSGSVMVSFARRYNLMERTHGVIKRMSTQLLDEKLKRESDFISWGHKPALKLEFPPTVKSGLYKYFMPAHPSVDFDAYGNLK